ncbi:unnamed protein product [Rhizophagus irregularis]|nr:unnamed protein product [Rhizophagus irregularis]
MFFKFSIVYAWILNQQSEILLGKSKDWELIRGVFNNRFNKISSKIEVKNLIDDLWYFCYDQCRINIWNKRCDKVNEIEKKKGIKKMDKRKCKIKELEVDIEENKEKSKKQVVNNKKDKNIEKKIKLVTKDRLIGRFTEEGKMPQWYLTMKVV